MVRVVAFWIDRPVGRLTIRSLDIMGQEQMAVAAMPANAFASEMVVRLVLPRMYAGDVMTVRFENPPGAPAQTFGIWFGEWADVQRKANEIRVQRSISRRMN